MGVIYLDSGILVDLLLGSNTRRLAIKSIIAGKKRATSVISFGEVLYVATALSAERIYGNRGRSAVRKFIKNRHVDYLTLYESVKDLYSLLNIEILPHPKTEIMDGLIEKYKLPPRDLIHAATAIENKCSQFLTLDSDFKQIKEGIKVAIIEN